MRTVGFGGAVKRLESGEWKAATTVAWLRSKSKISISIKKYKQIASTKKYKKRKVLELTHRDGSSTCWQITSSNIFEDRYVEAS